MWISSCLSTICWKDYVLPSLNRLDIFVKKSINHRCKNLHWTPIHFPTIFIAFLLPLQNYFWLLYNDTKFWNYQYNFPFNFAIFSRKGFGYFQSFGFNINFGNSLSITANKPADVLIEITLNLYINLRTAILTILNLNRECFSIYILHFSQQHLVVFCVWELYFFY